MTAHALPTRMALPAIPRVYACVAAIALVCALVRLPMLGDPAYRIDEQFYVLVGNRMLHGAIPYIDIWDRKPIGLFLIYAFAATFGEGFVPYQLLALLSVIGTSVCIFAISRRAAGDGAATISALLYPLWLQVADGGGGQSPVFYGLPVAAAALLLLQPEDGHSQARGRMAMLLIGLAIQIKYSVVIEGLLFGIVAVARAFRRTPERIVGKTLLLAAIALLPTFAAIGAYAAIGHVQEFWFANFTSIFLRGPTPAIELQFRAQIAFFRILPLGLCVLASVWELRHDQIARPWQAFMLLWCTAALLGFAAIGALYAHYLLPVFLPFTAAAAPIFRRRPLGWVLAVLCAWLPAGALHWPDFARTAQSHREVAALSALVPPDVDRGCMQMFDGPPILYHLTHACAATRYLFPDHLGAAMEAPALGLDAAAEVRRILATRPEVITIGETEVRPPNRATNALVRKSLARDYHLAGKVWMGGRNIEVFVRRENLAA